MSVHWALTTAMLMLLVLTLLEVSSALVTQAFKEMALPVKVRLLNNTMAAINVCLCP